MTLDELLFEARHIHATGDTALVGSEVRDFAQAVIESFSSLSAPIPMRLVCPRCCALHIDEGEFATKHHHTHACQNCGEVWRPAIVPTVGVRFLPGFKNENGAPTDPLDAISDEPNQGDRWYEQTSSRLSAVLDRLPGTVRVRIGYALHNRHIQTLEALLATPLSELRKIPNLGAASIDGIRQALASFGLELKR